MKSLNKKIGSIGEELAVKFLKDNGFLILKKNYKGFENKEIDIIAKDKDTISFIEVKTRSTSEFGQGFEAVDFRKIASYKKAALGYMQSVGLELLMRFDVISIMFDKNSSDYRIELIKNAF